MPKLRKPLKRLNFRQKQILAGMLERGNLTHQQIADYFGLTRSAVTQYAKQWQRILAIRRRRIKKQQRSHEQIVADVMAAIKERGYFTNIRELARIVGVSKTTIRKIIGGGQFVAIPLTKSSRPVYLITTKKPRDLLKALRALAKRNTEHLLTALEWLIQNNRQLLIGIIREVKEILREKQQNVVSHGKRETEIRIRNMYNRISSI